MGLELKDYAQYGLYLLAISVYVYRYIRKSREDAHEADQLKKVRAKQELTDSTAEIRAARDDALTTAEIRAETISEQQTQINRLKRKVGQLEDERDGCHEELSEVKDRLSKLEKGK